MTIYIALQTRAIFHNIFNYLLIYYPSISRLIYSNFPLLVKRKEKSKIGRTKYQFVLQLINPRLFLID